MDSVYNRGNVSIDNVLANPIPNIGESTNNTITNSYLKSDFVNFTGTDATTFFSSDTKFTLYKLSHSDNIYDINNTYEDGTYPYITAKTTGVTAKLCKQEDGELPKVDGCQYTDGSEVRGPVGPPTPPGPNPPGPNPPGPSGPDSGEDNDKNESTITNDKDKSQDNISQGLISKTGKNISYATNLLLICIFTTGICLISKYKINRIYKEY